ncbi:hypothetical protein [Clostridium merdae]|uniref:hypothetical protein n=1 Tax=Clostridium merdae TaxID=1958780 RepID=UPI0013564F75|nr:hypothetical protein [Clostridium merdae]
MEAIVGGIADVTTVVGAVFTMILGNPVLLFSVCASVAGVGFTIFRKAKKTAK